MVESYSKNANHNMRRPVVKDEIVDFMRTRQKPVAGALEELEAFARKENIPIIPHETLDYSCKPYNQRKSWKLGQQLDFQRS